MSEPLTEAELAGLTPGQRETIARVEAMAAQDAIDAANEITLVLTREQAELLLRTYGDAQYTWAACAQADGRQMSPTPYDEMIAILFEKLDQ